MTATPAGAAITAKMIRRVSSDTRSHFHDFGFFPLQQLVDLPHELVMDFLKILLGVLDVVLGNLVQLLKLVAALGARVTNSNARLFRQFVHDFDEISAPLFI